MSHSVTPNPRPTRPKDQTVRHLSNVSKGALAKQNYTLAEKLTRHAIKRLVQTQTVPAIIRGELYLQRAIALRALKENDSAVATIIKGLQLIGNPKDIATKIVKAQLDSELADGLLRQQKTPDQAISLLEETKEIIKEILKTPESDPNFSQGQRARAMKLLILTQQRFGKALWMSALSVPDGAKAESIRAQYFKRASTAYQTGATLATTLEGSTSEWAQRLEIKAAEALQVCGAWDSSRNEYLKAYLRIVSRYPDGILTAPRDEQYDAALILVQITGILKRQGCEKELVPEIKQLIALRMSLKTVPNDLAADCFWREADLARIERSPLTAKVKLELAVETYLCGERLMQQDLVDLITDYGTVALGLLRPKKSFENILKKIDKTDVLSPQEKFGIFRAIGRNLDRQSDCGLAFIAQKMALTYAKEIYSNDSFITAAVRLECAKSLSVIDRTEAATKYLENAIAHCPIEGDEYLQLQARALTIKSQFTGLSAPARIKVLKKILMLLSQFDSEPEETCRIYWRLIRSYMDEKNYDGADLAWGNLAEYDASLDLTHPAREALHAVNIGLFGELCMARGLPKTAANQFDRLLQFEDTLLAKKSDHYIYMLSLAGRTYLRLSEKTDDVITKKELKKKALIAFEKSEKIFRQQDFYPDFLQLERLEALQKLMNKGKSPKFARYVKKALMRARDVLQNDDDNGATV